MTLTPYMTGDLSAYGGALTPYTTAPLVSYEGLSPLDQALQYIVGGGGNASPTALAAASSPGPSAIDILGNQFLKKGMQKLVGYGMDELGVNDALKSGLDYLDGLFFSGPSTAVAGPLFADAASAFATEGLIASEALLGPAAAGPTSFAQFLPGLGMGALALQIAMMEGQGNIPDPIEQARFSFDPVSGETNFSAYSQDGGKQENAELIKRMFEEEFSSRAPDMSWYTGSDPLEIFLTRDLKQRGAFRPYVQGGDIAYSGGYDTRGQPIGLEGRRYMGGLGPDGLTAYNDNPAFGSPDDALETIFAWLMSPNETDYGYLRTEQERQDNRLADGGMLVDGPGDGRSDNIPAMLSNDEYVIPADVVSALGRGSSDAGADILDSWIAATRTRYREHLGALPPPR